MKSYEAEKTEDLTNVIFLDVETWSGDKPPIELFEPKANLVDPLKIIKDVEEKQDKAWRAQSLDPFLGEIFCIGLKVDDEPSFIITGTDEQELAECFDIELQNYSYPKIIAHFGDQFDFHFLFIKGLQYRMRNIVNAFCGHGGGMLIDTSKIIRGTNYRAMVSLDKMTKTLTGSPAKKGIHGSDVHDLILAGKGQTVCDYCLDDVDALYKDCKVLASFGLL